MPKPSELVLIDTSAWVAALRSDGPEAARSRVDEALADGSAATSEPIVAELLVGARDEAEFGRLSTLLGALPELCAAETWQGCARLGYEARRAGVSVPLVDLLVAATAIGNDCVLLHADRHYQLLAGVSSLRQMAVLQG